MLTFHKLDKITFPTGAVINSVKNATTNFNVETQNTGPSGEPFPTVIYSKSQQPTIEFSTPCIANMLAAGVGVDGYSISGGTALSLYDKLADAITNYGRGSTSHIRYDIKTCILHWTSIRLPHRGEGEMQCVATALYDGTNLPITVTGSVALAGSLGSYQAFGCGPVSINGTTISGIEDITINSGLKFNFVSANSEQYTTGVYVEECAPTVTIKASSRAINLIAGMAGAALTGAGLVFYARALAVANNIASHISFSCPAGAIIPDQMSGDMNSHVSDTITVRLVSSNGLAKPIVATTGVTI